MADEDLPAKPPARLTIRVRGGARTPEEERRRAAQAQLNHCRAYLRDAFERGQSWSAAIQSTAHLWRQFKMANDQAFGAFNRPSPYADASLSANIINTLRDDWSRWEKFNA